MRLKKCLVSISLCVLCGVAAGCSIAPDVQVTKQMLDSTNIYSRFVIEESPETLIHALNQNGSAVVRATYRNAPVYIKLFATSRQGVVWYMYPRER